MPEELTPEAKAEIAAAVRIVRSDRMERLIRDGMAKHAPKPADPPPTPPIDPPKPPNDPPKPSNDPPTPPPPIPPTPPEDPPKRRSRYWGDLD